MTLRTKIVVTKNVLKVKFDCNLFLDAAFLHDEMNFTNMEWNADFSIWFLCRIYLISNSFSISIRHLWKTSSLSTMNKYSDTDMAYNLDLHKILLAENVEFNFFLHKFVHGLPKIFYWKQLVSEVSFTLSCSITNILLYAKCNCTP